MSCTLLHGIRVLDMTQIRAGPKAAKWLADAGAEVIKVESRQRSDDRGFARCGRVDLQSVPLEAVPERDQRGQNRLGFEQLHRNKLGLSIDLSTSEGIGLFRQMAAVSDVVMENFSFGVMERLGLGYHSLCQVRPDFIMISMPGFGDSGPHRDYVAFGWGQEHMAGITVATGYAGGPPLKTGTIAVGAVMAALLYRARTGVGQFIDFSQLESLICLVGETVLDYSVNGWVAGRNGNGHSVYAPHGVYPCQGHDKWISIAVTNDAEWVALCGVMQRSDLAKDPRFEGVAVRHRNQDSLDPIPGEWTSRQERYQAMGLLQAAGVPARSVLDQDEALTGPQAEHRGFLANLTHPDNVQHPYINSPAQFSRTPAGVRTPGPLLGQHNSYILGELLGLSAEQLDSLEVSGVTATLSTDLSGE